MRCVLFVWALLCLAGCVGPEDNRSTVKDLRVLGMRLDPPELLAEACSQDLATLLPLARPLRLTVLLADPAGQGRDIDYTLWACASVSDSTCAQERVELARGVTGPGELVVDLVPGPVLAQLPDGTPLAQRVLEQDSYRGLGGLRLPLVLWVRAGSEQVYAQKLMVYGCRFFPDMAANVQPVLQGLRLAGEPWEEEPVLELSGPGPFQLEPEDFSALQEPYVVPSFELQPVRLEEQWVLAWHTSLGIISPNETGGADFGGQSQRHRVEWTPLPGAPAGEVRFWVTVRDGRGGLSWVTRTVRYAP